MTLSTSLVDCWLHACKVLRSRPGWFVRETLEFAWVHGLWRPGGARMG